jgi:5-methylcytosine-specific restriction endonuclease McrBC regulatory subunit McrC
MKETLITDNNAASKQLLIAERKVQEINSTVKSLYKDKLSGKIPETFFFNLLGDYEKDLKDAEDKIHRLRDQVKVEEGNDEKVKKWVNVILKYLKVEKLDRFMARELIDTITVSEFYKVNGKNVQDVVIKYKFVGNLQMLLQKIKDVA